MMKRKRIRRRGKLRLSEYFKELNKGDRVAVVRELSEMPKFPKTLQGRTGTVDGKKGKFYIVRIMDYDQEKTHIIHPVHLKKLA